LLVVRQLVVDVLDARASADTKLGGVTPESRELLVGVARSGKRFFGEPGDFLERLIAGFFLGELAFQARDVGRKLTQGDRQVR
jgi:hypothetical protein